MGTTDDHSRYRTLFETNRDALMLFSRDGYFDCNSRALEVFGVESVAEFLTYAPWDLAPPTQPDGTDSKEAALARIETAFEEGGAFFEYTHRRVDGTEFPAEVKLTRFEEDGESVLQSLVRDISERAAYERELKRQRDNLEILNQVLRHDIRNDIQLVLAHAELIATRCADDDIDSHVQTVLESADHAVELTTTARQMANVMLSTGESRRRLDAVAPLRRVVREVQGEYPDAVVTTDLPATATVRADEMLETVFRNLVKNAIQHTDREVPSVDVAARVAGETVTVRVADNGPGVPDARKDEVFGKGETGLASSGTGLGLYLVKTLVDNYGGTVGIEDNEPTGAVFVVELPT